MGFLLPMLVGPVGCGGWWTAPPSPEQALWEYRDARLAGDAARTCAALSAASRSALEDSIGWTCPKAGHVYDDTETVHVRRWRISSVVVRGDRATVHLAPGSHVVDRTLKLVREPGGWKLERAIAEMTEQAGWEHCVLKVAGDASVNPGWRELGTDTIFTYAERYCDAVDRLPRDAEGADFDRTVDATIQSLAHDGLISPERARELIG